MQKYVTVSAKISLKVRARMRRLGIKPSTVFKKGLEAEFKSEEMEELKRKIKRLKPILDKIPIEDVVASIREDRSR